MMKNIIDKKKFYENWKPSKVWSESKKAFVRPKVFFTRFHQKLEVPGSLELYVEWKADYARNIFTKIYCKIMDQSKTGSKKQVCKDLCFDLDDFGITSDYQLYKWLNDWAQEEYEDYVAGGYKGYFERSRS